MPSKYLSGEPRIAHPGFGDPWPLGSGPDRRFPLGGFVPLPAPGARQAGPGPVGPVLCRRPQSVRAPSAGANNVALPSLPVPAPFETLVCKREHAGQGRSGAGLVLLGVGTEALPPNPAPVGPPRPGREATSPAAEWKPVRQVTNRWVVTVISQRMRHRSLGHSKLIRSDQHPYPTPARATNTHRREPIKREPVRPART